MADDKPQVSGARSIESIESIESGPKASRARPLLVAVPLLIFVILSALFAAQLFSGRDPATLPSVLIDKPVPRFDLKPLEGLVRDGAPVPGFSSADLATGKVSVVNVWASWCVPCRLEHPYVTELGRHANARLFVLNYKDKGENALGFLAELGNPFHAVGTDENGRTGIDFGVYGVPETFIIDGAGTIRYKHVGPLNPDSLIKIREIIDTLAQAPAPPAK